MSDKKKKKRPISFWSKLVAKGMLGKEVQPRIYVSDLIDEFLATEDYDFRNFANAFPPFSEFWMEGKQGSDSYGFLINSWRVHKDRPDPMIVCRIVQTFNAVFNQGKVSPDAFDGQRQIAQDLLAAISIACVRFPGVLIEAMNLINPDLLEGENKLKLPPIEKMMPFPYEWVVSLTLIVGGQHSEPIIAANVVYMLDEEGLTPIGKKFAITLGKEPKDRDSIPKVMQSMVAFTCHALSLMNCKNIVLKDVATKPSKHFQRVDRRKEIIFKVLMIDTMAQRRKKKASDGDGPKLERFTRLHVCRGHKADYRKGKGLFGKYNGIFFVPSHARGTPRDGMVIKDYEFK